MYNIREKKGANHLRLNNSRKIGKCITIALIAISTLSCIGCQENTNNQIQSEYQMEAINAQIENDINTRLNTKEPAIIEVV